MLPRSLAPNSSICLVLIQESHFVAQVVLKLNSLPAFTSRLVGLHICTTISAALLYDHTLLSRLNLPPATPKEEEVGRKEGKLLHANQIHVEPSLFGGWLSVYFPFFSPQRFYNIFVCKQVFLFVSHELLLHNVMSLCTVIHRK